jgi:hypothetical protein
MNTKRTSKKATLWHGRIPGIFGYGIEVLARTQSEAYDALRKSYNDWKEAQPDSSTTFETSFKYWGGFVQPVELGKAYHEGFRS